MKPDRETNFNLRCIFIILGMIYIAIPSCSDARKSAKELKAIRELLELHIKKP